MTTGQGLALSAFVMMTATGLFYQLGGLWGWYSRSARLVFKGCTTLLAALLALWGAWQGGNPAHWWLAAGLALCALADVALELRFKLGMLVFALGHLCYIRSFLLLAPPDGAVLWRFLLLALLCAGGAFAMRKRLSQPPLLVLGYALVISLMLALALSQRPALAIGALLFAFSDGLIFWRLSFQAGKVNDSLCILTYWLGQFLIALSTVL